MIRRAPRPAVLVLTLTVALPAFSCGVAAAAPDKKVIFPPLATAVVEPVGSAYGGGALAIDGSDIFMFGGGLLRRLSKKGGKPAVLADGRIGVHVLVARGDDLFWIEHDGNKGIWRIDTVPKKGGEVRVLFEGVVAEESLAVDDRAVWFATGKDKYKPNEIASVPHHGPTTTATLAALQGTVCSVAVDDKFVYAAQCDAQKIVRVAKTGGAPQVLAEPIDSPYMLRLTGDRVLFDTRGNAGVWEVPKAGGKPQPASLGLASLTNFYAADGDDVAFVPTPVSGRYTGRDATVVWVRRDTKSAVTLDPEMDTPGPIAIDATHIYWVRKGKELVRAKRR